MGMLEQPFRKRKEAAPVLVDRDVVLAYSPILSGVFLRLFDALAEFLFGNLQPELEHQGALVDQSVFEPCDVVESSLEAGSTDPSQAPVGDGRLRPGAHIEPDLPVCRAGAKVGPNSMSLNKELLRRL